MAGRIVSFEKVLDIVGRDSYVDEDSSEDDEEPHLNALPSAADGTVLPLADVATISRSFGSLIPPCERDSLLVFNDDLAEDKVALIVTCLDNAMVSGIRYSNFNGFQQHCSDHELHVGMFLTLGNLMAGATILQILQFLPTRKAHWTVGETENQVVTVTRLFTI